MSRTISSDTGALGGAFERARAEGRAALVVYTTAGYPEPARGLDALLALADNGADVIELGVPFSDPLADGPTIQAASFEAIRRGVDLRGTLDLLRRFRAVRDVPVVVFSYLNPILRFGTERFVAEAADAGASGVLVTDLPLGADPATERLLTDGPLDLIRLVAPTSEPDRAREIAAASQGFVYYISRTGVTGARQELAGGIGEEVELLRGAASVPIAVGFGISTPDQVRAVAALADGVVVGSALVDRLGRDGIEAAGRLVGELRAATTR